VREEGERLEHHAGRAPVGRHLVDALAAQQDLAAARLFQAGQHAHQGRLAGARRPDDGEELALFDVEVDLLYRREAAEVLGQPGKSKNGFGHVTLLFQEGAQIENRRGHSPKPRAVADR
jgi:hypothetical protein